MLVCFPNLLGKAHCPVVACDHDAGLLKVHVTEDLAEFLVDVANHLGFASPVPVVCKDVGSVDVQEYV